MENNFSVLCPVAWDQALQWGKRKKRGQTGKISRAKQAQQWPENGKGWHSLETCFDDAIP